MITITRYHDFDAGHRISGHEGKCQHLHGHSYRVHFTVASTGLDPLGRVVDFGVVKQRLCNWLEHNWDHKMLIWYKDPMCAKLRDIDPEGVTVVGFNPTAENMAHHLVEFVGPRELCDMGWLRLVSVKVEETRKCSATYSTYNLEMKEKEHD